MLAKPISRPNVNQQTLARARTFIEKATNIVVLTGAGVSTDSGIPDFRGANGVWTQNPSAAAQSNIDTYLSSPAHRRAAWAKGLNSLSGFEPNDNHRMIANFVAAFPVTTLITQNVDGLHQAAGTNRDVVVEAHGNVQQAVCCDCDQLWSMGVIHERVRMGDEDPHCFCGGPIKANVIMFNEMLRQDVFDRMLEATGECDLFITIGTSLHVPPCASLPQMARNNGADVMIINNQSTPQDMAANIRLRGQLADILPHIL